MTNQDLLSSTCKSLYSYQQMGTGSIQSYEQVSKKRTTTLRMTSLVWEQGTVQM